MQREIGDTSSRFWLVLDAIALLRVNPIQDQVLRQGKQKAPERAETRGRLVWLPQP